MASSASATSDANPEENVVLPKKRKRVDLSKFADLEAEEVGGSGEEEDEGFDEEFIDNDGGPDTDATRSKLRKKMNFDKELKELSHEMASRGPLVGAARLFSSDRLDDMERRFQAMDDAARRGEDVSGLDISTEPVKQTVTVPEAKDPRLWCLKTFGPEQELCIKLMWKAFESIRAGDPIPVSSVFTVPYVRGYIYLEAPREADVRRFTKGINGVSQYTGLSLVPIDQMAGVFSAAMSSAQKVNIIRPGDWVRLKKGPYRGDLAQVEEVDDEMHLLKMKPRILGGQIAKGNKKIYPPKWFHKGDMQATQEVLVQVEPRRTQKGFKLFYVANGEAYRDGFLYKNLRSTAFVSGSDVRPTEYELADWRNAPPISEDVRPPDDMPKSKEEEDREKMPPPPVPVKDTGPVLQDGEQVIVHSGDLKNLRGWVTKAVFGSPTVLIQPKGVDVKGDLSIATSRLCKYFEIGDYVTVLNGDHAGDAGHVEQVELGTSNSWGSHATARILTSDYSSFRASLNDLRRSLERPETHNQVGEFQIGQLVLVLNHDTRAIIVRLEAGDRAMVLGINGVKSYVSLAELQPLQMPPRLQYKRQVWCQDKKMRKLVPGCVVKAPHSYSGGAPVTSEVLYIHQGWVFLRAIEGLVGERAYLVAPGDKCEYVWDPDDMPKGKGKGKKQMRPKITVPDKTIEELSSKQLSYGIKMASEISFLKIGWHKMLGLSEKPAGAPSGGGLSAGANVKITGGNYKGMRGEIRDFLDDRVRISLLSAPKLVEVSVNQVQEDFIAKPQADKYLDSNTPVAAPMPVPKETKTMEQTLAEGRGLEHLAMPTDEQAWDPNYLMTDGADSAPLTPAVSIVSSSRRRRKPRLAAELLAETEAPANGS